MAATAGAAASNSITAPGIAAFSGTQNLNGGLGGGQIGYNWQFNRNWVIGLEADIQGTGERGNAGLPTIVTVPGLAAVALPTITTTADVLAEAAVVRHRARPRRCRAGGSGVGLCDRRSCLRRGRQQCQRHRVGRISPRRAVCSGNGERERQEHASRVDGRRRRRMGLHQPMERQGSNTFTSISRPSPTRSPGRARHFRQSPPERTSPTTSSVSASTTASAARITERKSATLHRVVTTRVG